MRQLRVVRQWIGEIADPVKVVRAPRGYSQFLKDWFSYRRIPGVERLRIADAYPQVHDRTPTTSVDSHYFYSNAWAMRRIASRRPTVHVDVASHHMLIGMLAGVVPVVFVDYRPLDAPLTSMHRVAGNALELPFADSSVKSLSCLHAAEHFGLGRYGDPLDPEGTRKACHELTRVLAPAGVLMFAVPVGRHRTCFNAHRVHSASTVIDYFSGLKLGDFSFVNDDGRLFEHATLEDSGQNEYGCGLFEFHK